MHEHLRQIGAVRLILRLTEYQLYGADGALHILRNEQRPFALSHPVGHVPPEIHRLLHRQRMHEAHRCTAFHAIDQQLGKSVNLRVVHR